MSTKPKVEGSNPSAYDRLGTQVVKRTVCKTVNRGFDSHPSLLHVDVGGVVNALDCGSRFHQFESGTPTYFGRLVQR